MKFFKKAIKFGTALTAVVATPAISAPVVLTSLTDSVDFSTTTSAVLLVGASLITVYIAMKAVRLVTNAVR